VPIGQRFAVRTKHTHAIVQARERARQRLRQRAGSGARLARSYARSLTRPNPARALPTTPIPVRTGPRFRITGSLTACPTPPLSVPCPPPASQRQRRATSRFRPDVGRRGLHQPWSNQMLQASRLPTLQRPQLPLRVRHPVEIR
jgi:hypothetical protein